MTTRILIKSRDLAEVHKLLNEKKKIQAIKLVRNNGRILGPATGEKSNDTPGLREAKLAIDNLCDPYSHANTEVLLVPDWRVHSVTVTGPAGEKIELDLENLQMHFLTSLTSVGLEEVGRLLELIDFVKQWQGDITIPSLVSPKDEEQDRS